MISSIISSGYEEKSFYGNTPDQREIVNQDSLTDFGETIITRTNEGVDQREIF
jgi:hypothetical protein